MRRHFKWIKQLAVEGAALTALVTAGLIVYSRAANSDLAARATGVPVLGTAVRAARAGVNQIVTPVSDL